MTKLLHSSCTLPTPGCFWSQICDGYHYISPEICALMESPSNYVSHVFIQEVGSGGKFRMVERVAEWWWRRKLMREGGGGWHKGKCMIVEMEVDSRQWRMMLIMYAVPLWMKEKDGGLGRCTTFMIPCLQGHKYPSTSRASNHNSIAYG